MKPNFALSLSHQGIRLIHRSASGWMPVGETALDDPQLLDRLKVLRKTAVELESGGFLTKLILPDSQVLYTTLPAPGPDDSSRVRQIRIGLEGLTPYDVDDLVFDWRPEGAYARVAVVAKDTLDEAEAFASDHRMNPICFAAQPDEDSFPGEPFFGQARHAATLLNDGETVDPDDPWAKMMPPPRQAEGGSPSPAAIRSPDIAPPSKPSSGPAPPKAPKPAKTAPPPMPPNGAGAPAADTASVRNRFRLKRDTGAGDALPAAAPAAAKPASRGFASLSPFGRSDPTKDTPATDKAVIAPAGDSVRQPELAAAETTATVAEGPAFSTRRDRAPAPATKGKSKPKSKSAPPPRLEHARGRLGIAAAEAATQTPAAPDSPARSRALTAAAASGGAAPRPNGAARNGMLAAGAPQPAPAEGAGEGRVPLPSGKAITGALSPLLGRGRAWAERARNFELPKLPKPDNTKKAAAAPVATLPDPRPEPQPAAKASPRAKVAQTAKAPSAAKAMPPKPGPEAKGGGKVSAEEAEALTLFGQRGKPQPNTSARRLGLALTGALIVVMAIVAFWGLFFTSPGPDTNPQVAVAPSAAPQAPAPGTDAGTPAAGTDTATTGPDGPAPAESELATAPPVELPATDPVTPVITAIGDGPVTDPDADTGTEAPTPDTDTAAADPEAAVPDPDAAPANAEAAPADTDVAAAETDTDATAPDPDVAAPAGPTIRIVEDPLGGSQPLQPGTDVGSTDAAVLEALLEDAAVDGVEPLTREGAEARYAATGIWQIAPEPSASPQTDRLEDVAVTTIDPVMLTPEASSLGDTGSGAGDARPVVGAPPSPPGTRFDLDERGLVQATPDGTLSPDGIRIYLGSPPIIPQTRPAGVAPAAEAAAPPPPLPDVRPPLRPADLTLADDRAQLDGAARAQLAALDTDAAPDTLPALGSTVPAAAEAAVVTEAASAASLAALEPLEGTGAGLEAEAEVATRDLGGSELAVAASLFPRERPEDLAPPVETAALEPLPEPVPPAPNVAPARAPAVPSNASVTREATIEGGLRLGRVNLIGVYGSAQDRRALVRLPSGRYVKVQVGDRVDGGEVAAIGEDELRYVKGGRSLVLSMPRG